MMKPHCDRCDELCNELQTWVEDNESLIDERGQPMVGSGTNPIWHVTIVGGGNAPKMFCRACRIAILELHVKALKMTKGEGGHLADCQWSIAQRQYICAEGCGIKRLNESMPLGAL